MKCISLSMSSFSYATISSSGISPLEKMFARDTYCDNLDFRFSLSPSASYQLYFTCTAVYYTKKFLNVFNIRYLHVNILLSTCNTFFHSFSSWAHYSATFPKFQQIFGLVRKIPNSHKQSLILPGSLGIFITDSLITECFNTGRSPLRKLEGDMQRKTDGCRIPVSLP